MRRFRFFAAICVFTLALSVACGAVTEAEFVDRVDGAYKDDARYMTAPAALKSVDIADGVRWEMLDLVVNANPEWRVNWIVHTPTRSGIGFVEGGRQWSVQFNLETFEQVYQNAATTHTSFSDRFPTKASLMKMGATELAVIDLAANLTKQSVQAGTVKQRDAWWPLLLGLKLSSLFSGDYRFESKSLVAHVRLSKQKGDVNRALVWLFDSAGSYRGYMVIKQQRRDDELLREKLPDLLSRLSLDIKQDG